MCTLQARVPEALLRLVIFNYPCCSQKDFDTGSAFGFGFIRGVTFFSLVTEEGKDEAVDFSFLFIILKHKEKAAG